MLSLIEITEVYDTQGVEKSPVLKPFFDIQPQVDQLNTLRTHNLAEAAREQAGDRPSPKRYSGNLCPKSQSTFHGH